MSTLTAGIMSFSFALTSCSDDDILGNEVVPPEMEKKYNGPLQEPYGLSYYDFLTAEDVTILNADTTEISINKALADKLGITNFENHPIGIWDSPSHMAYGRKGL